MNPQSAQRKNTPRALLNLCVPCAKNAELKNAKFAKNPQSAQRKNSPRA